MRIFKVKNTGSFNVKIVFFAVILFFTLYVSVFFRNRAYAIQYGTNFRYSNLTMMCDDGWTLGESGVSLKQGGGIILDGSKGSTSIGYFQGVPKNVTNWKIGVQAMWLGGVGHSYLDIKIHTNLHNYVWAVDGSIGKYVLLRDGVNVFEAEGYNEKANTLVELTIEKNGPTIGLYFNGERIEYYTEKDIQEQQVIGGSITSPPSSAALYVWAGVFIPEAVSGIDPTPQPIEDYEEIPSPEDPYDPEQEPVDDTNQPDELYPNGVRIILIEGTNSLNTNSPSPLETGYYSMELINGVCQNGAMLYEQSLLLAAENECTLQNSGGFSPETINQFNPLGGYSPNFIVTVNQHVSSSDSLNPWTPSSVAIVTYTVTDGLGNVLIQNQITGNTPTQLESDALLLQAGAAVNLFIQNTMTGK